MHAIDVASGKGSRISDRTWFVVQGVEWDATGNGLLVRGTERGAIRSQVWYISYPSGAVTSITNDANDYNSASATTDFQQLCVVHYQEMFQFVTSGSGHLPFYGRVSGACGAARKDQIAAARVAA